MFESLHDRLTGSPQTSSASQPFPSHRIFISFCLRFTSLHHLYHRLGIDLGQQDMVESRNDRLMASPQLPHFPLLLACNIAYRLDYDQHLRFQIATPFNDYFSSLFGLRTGGAARLTSFGAQSSRLREI